ncbi:hypothetical protein [Novosphingobium colocasiae]|uniref:Uncharacterized protein n=1 Tax=Novosphingobium colocasiae TaxID=1256513 RepID=A0A918P8Z0_9SPHN|nr:hypothetical protein [Novosphingobium colocasiae]GGY92894.1 hypothetical protein GCM10011614_04680 [Novosphingobium colocasiae]
MGVIASGHSDKAGGLGTPSVFAGWPVGLARLALLALALLLAAAAVLPVGRPDSDPGARHTRSAGTAASTTTADEDDEDIALYKAAIRRIQAGQNYYDFIVPEQRARDYPVNPGLAVRLPTLAYLDAWLGGAGQIVAAVLLMAGVIAAWWAKFGEDPNLKRLRRLATAMVFVGASLGLNRYYFVLHELWAGMLVALSFGLHRIGQGGQGGRWIAAWAAAALALAIREHTLPYVLLMGATALWLRNWREAAAWGALVAVFLAVMSWHLAIIAAQVLPGDPHGPAWLVMRGIPGWLGNVVQSSNLRWLPHWLAGPAVILMTFGWLGWNSRAGVVAFLLSAGYGAAFMLAGRWDNFYWGAMIAPVMFAGIVFAPRALTALGAAARLEGLRRTRVVLA